VVDRLGGDFAAILGFCAYHAVLGKPGKLPRPDEWRFNHVHSVHCKAHIPGMSCMWFRLHVLAHACCDLGLVAWYKHTDNDHLLHYAHHVPGVALAARLCGRPAPVAELPSAGT
jgi:hypothetical protein